MCVCVCVFVCVCVCVCSSVRDVLIRIILLFRQRAERALHQLI